MAVLNGRLPASMLAPIPGTKALVRADLAQQVGALRGAFRARFGRPLVVTDAYRSYDDGYFSQVATFLRRYTTRYLPGRPTKTWNGRTYWQLPGTAMAATPGTSNHGDGEALDLGSGVNVMDSTEHRWLVANAPAFGFVWPRWARGAREAWHFEATRAVPVSTYRHIPGALDIPGVTLPDLVTLTPVIPEDIMAVHVRHPNGTVALAAEDGTFEPLLNTDELEARKAAGLVKLHDGPAGTMQLLDGLIWDKLAAVSYRKAMRSSPDPAALAAGVAALVIPSIVGRLTDLTAVAGMGEGQLRDIVEAATRDVLGSLND